MGVNQDRKKRVIRVGKDCRGGSRKVCSILAGEPEDWRRLHEEGIMAA